MSRGFDARAAARALSLAQRVAVIGSPGAGKSTVARALTEALDIPVHHLDRLYWRPGWEPTPLEEWRQLQAALVAAPRWIIDGNYGKTLGLRLARAQVVLFLDLPSALCLVRVVLRGVAQFGQVRSDMGEGCKEQLDLGFLHYTARFRRDVRPDVLAMRAEAPPGLQHFP